MDILVVPGSIVLSDWSSLVVDNRVDAMVEGWRPLGEADQG